MTVLRTQVGIVGAGPAGLLLSHLLARAGIESVILDSRSREEIETTVRAGILEHGTVEILSATGASERVLSEGHRHDGIELHFAGERQRIDFAALVGRGVYLYPQHEVLKDLIAVRLAEGQDIRFGVSATSAEEQGSVARVFAGVGAEGSGVGAEGSGVGAERSGVGAERSEVEAESSGVEVEADFVVGADGSRSVIRAAVTGSSTAGHFHEYPFAWFGILCEAPPSAPELIYSNSPHGFALISQRSTTVQRMYFQCDPEQDPEAMSDAAIWEQLQSRVPAQELKEGRIFQRDVLRFRSFVAESLRRGRIALVGDAAHTVPPTGAKGLNLAVADVVLLSRALEAFLGRGDESLLDAYEATALRRIWKAQHFSWWMTSMLHTAADATEFDRLRQLGELRSVVDSEAGRRFLAEAYTGWPMPAV